MRFKEKYIKEVVPKMMERFGYKNLMAVPRIEKVSINTGFGKMIAGLAGDEQKKITQGILGDLALLSGQKAILTLAKKSIASFKTRKGMPLGAKVILRKKRMEDFLERLINTTLPRIRDFRGLDEKSVDSQGNLTIGIKEHIVFPEISPEGAKKIFGLEITVTTTAKNKEKGLELLKLAGFPIKT